jgi:serine/threonine protein kinase/tetratricopeptide (TPR) repeat protein
MSASEVEQPLAIGPYLIDGTLGSGGMGVVYVATHRDSRRRVALKTVRLPTPDALASIRLEIGTLTRLRHPGIVDIVDQGVSSGGPWFAMELLEGETLAARHQKIWPRPSSEASTPRAGVVVWSRQRDAQTDEVTAPPGVLRSPVTSLAAAGRLTEILALYRRLCGPLAFLHGKGIVHRDLKPANVFLRAHDVPVLMDFGLIARARGAVGREELGGTRGIRGTLSYLAPEICEGQTPDTRADLYALGCMLWEALTGWPPFEAATVAELVSMHIRAKPGRPSDLVVGVPERLDDLVVRLLAKRPQDRVGQAQDVAEELGEIEGASGSLVSSPGFKRTGQLFRPKLVGRDSALAHLLACSARTRGGVGSLALILGESGIGKTFLASEVAQRASIEGIRVITGECVPVAPSEGSLPERSGEPLHPFRQLLQAMGDRCRQLGAPEVERLFGSHVALLTPYEPGLAEIAGVAGAAEPPPLPTEAARERLMTALREALVAFVADCPTLLVLDDLQWADELSLALLSSFTEAFLKETPVAVLCTYRTDEAEDKLRSLSERPGVEKVDLGRLHPGEVAAMVADMLAVGQAPDALVTFVQEHSEGIPFFVAEYLRAAAADGVLTRRGGQWLVGKPQGKRDAAGIFTAVALPRNVAGLVRLRLSRLSAGAVRVAEAASILGREWEAWALPATTDLEPAALAPLLVELVDRQVLDGAAPGHYRFLHDKIREEAYRGIDPERRRKLHLRAAQGLEERQRDDPTTRPRYADLAYHLLVAGEPQRALEYLGKAGEQELAMAAHGDAARHLQEALAVAAALPEPQPPLRIATWERELGDSFLGLGKISEGIAALSRAAAALGLPLPPSKMRIALRLIPELGRQVLYRLFPGRRRGVKARRPAEILEAGRIFDRLLRAFYYKGQYLELLFTNLRTLNLSELAGPAPELAMAYASAAATATMIPIRKLAQTYFDLAFTTLRQAPDPVVESHLEMLVGLSHYFMGERGEAIRHTEAAMELARAAGFSRRHDEAASIRIGVDLTPGRHEPAMPLIAEMEASASRRGDTHMRSWTLLLRAQCCILQGAFNPAREFLAEVEALLPSLGQPETISTFAHLAYVFWRQGDLTQARTYLAKATSEVSQGPPVHAACTSAYARLAEMQVAMARSAPPSGRRSSLRAAARACKLLLRAARTFPNLDPLTALHEGGRLWLTGQRKHARLAWRRGLERARALGDHYAGARLALVLGESLDAGTSERGQLETYARSSLQELKIGELEASDSLLTSPSRSPARA